MKNTRKPVVKRPLLIAVACVALATVALAAPGIQKWLFEDQNEMEQTVRTYADNPRATYYIITRAHERNLAAQTAVVYYDLLKKKPSDPYLQSAFAFSHFMATGLFSREFMHEKSSALVMQLRRQQLEAAHFRDEALRQKPNSPVILVQTALFLSADGQDKEGAVNLLRRAVKQDPKWADAQFHLGSALTGWWKNDREERVKIAEEALPHLREAEKLEPKLHTDCLASYAYAYQMLGDNAKTLQYLEAYIKGRPEAAENEVLKKWHKQLRDKVLKEKDQLL